jgi:putative FmdB family regulatory protein
VPIYEYVCLDCQEQFETLVLGSDEEVTCPSCQSDKLERAMSCFAKGSSGTKSGSGLSSACSGTGGFS